MTKHPLAQYSLKDFDKYNCLTLSYSFYGVLLFLLKGWAIGMVSLSNFKDKLSVIQWIYPDSNLFYLSLLTGAPGLFLMYVIFQRKPEASVRMKFFWRHILLLATGLIIFDFVIYWAMFLFLQLGRFDWLIGQTLFGVSTLLYCRFSARAKINRLEFPEKIEEPSGPRKRKSVV